MVNKRIVIICTLITLVVILSIVGFQIKLWKENYENLDVRPEPDIENMIDSALNETKTNENETADNTIANETNDNQNTVPGEEEITGNNNQSSANSEDEAISLAKKEWGDTDETVYYTVDNASEKIYIVSVRSKSTTAQLAEYEVNIETKKVTIR